MSVSFESMVTSDFLELLALYPQSATLAGSDIAVVQGVAESLGITFEPGGSIETLKVALVFLKCDNPVPTENAPVIFHGRNYRIESEGIEDMPGLWQINLTQEVA